MRASLVTAPDSPIAPVRVDCAGQPMDGVRVDR
jgi:hypothetical protein